MTEDTKNKGLAAMSVLIVKYSDFCDGIQEVYTDEEFEKMVVKLREMSDALYHVTSCVANVSAEFTECV